jgi:MFS family permease
MFGALVVLCMVRDLGFAAGILRTIWAVGGLSSFVGSVFAGPATRRLRLGPAMTLGWTLFSIALLLIPLAQGATLVAALLLIGQQILGDGAMTLYQINHVSLRQAITPNGLLGRVKASVEFLKLGAALVGSLLGGLMGNTFGVRRTFVAGALDSLLSTFLVRHVTDSCPRHRARNNCGAYSRTEVKLCNTRRIRLRDSPWVTCEDVESQLRITVHLSSYSNRAMRRQMAKKPPTRTGGQQI